MRFYKKCSAFFAAACLATSVGFLSGCDTKEKVLDIETPGGEIEVERDRTNGDVEVEVNK
ncbi:hypothetical protein [Thalassoglobus sp.]|uniref:hypothetical protein n=1 Tax=Thalassoglobus sp. TaxID=2795869 RepID=UPI003AA7D00F